MSHWDAKTKLVFYGAGDDVTDADRSSFGEVPTSTASCTTLIPGPASGVLIELPEGVSSASVLTSKVSTVTAATQNKEDLVNRLTLGHTECNMTYSSRPKAASVLTSARTECNVTYSSGPKASAVPTTGLPTSFNVGRTVGPSQLPAFNAAFPGTDLARRNYDDRNETRRIRAQSSLSVTPTDDFSPLPTYPQSQTSYGFRRRYPNEFYHQFGIFSEDVYGTRRMETSVLQPQVGMYSDEIRSGNGDRNRRNKPTGYRRPISKGQSYFSDPPTGLGSRTYPAQSPSTYSMAATSDPPTCFGPHPYPAQSLGAHPIAATSGTDTWTQNVETLCDLMSNRVRLPPPSARGSDIICNFCKKNGERRCVYTSHRLIERGKVTCPILRKYVCKTCGATGDDAHTASYCPLGDGASTVEATRTPKKSCGCARSCRHTDGRHH